MLPLSLRNHLLNTAELAPGLVLPLIVSVFLSPEANAYFYTTWMVATLLITVPQSTSRTLFVHGAAVPEAEP